MGEDAQEDEVAEEDVDDGVVEQVPVTWHEHIAPIVAERCAGCHYEGGIAPFALETYEQAQTWGEMMLEATLAGDMPPWGAEQTDECQTRYGFVDDPSLDDAQLELLGAWIDDGKLLGDPADAAPLPSPPDLSLSDADVTLEMPGEIEIDGGKDQFWCYVLDPEFDNTTFIDGIQVTAGNAEIVHHVLLYIDEGGSSVDKAGDDGRYECFGGPGISGDPALIAAWAPGAPPMMTPEGVGLMIQPGSKLVMNVHYHPTGEPQTDAGTSVSMRRYQGVPDQIGQLVLIGNFGGSIGGGMGLQSGPNDEGDNPQFRIPAGVDDHTETMFFRLPQSLPELKIWSVASHMHYVGTDMLIAVARSNWEDEGWDQECLLHTPRYDFNWQRGYKYDAPLSDVPIARPGDILYLRCGYNNSMSNAYVAEALAGQGLDAPVDVYLGEETLDEMCLGVFGVAFTL